MSFDFDLFVIGGGSGGVRAGRVSAQLGKKVAVAEEYRFGGTCVIRGCVPKKLFVYASQFSEKFVDAKAYGWDIGETRFDWPTLIANKDREIARLEHVYRGGLDKTGVTIFDERATLKDRNTVQLASGKTVTAEHILIATGARANPHDALPGSELAIYSDDIFDLKELPRSIVIVGGGYIAVEFANIFHGLGVDTTIVYRGQKILGGFDQDLRDHLQEEMQSKGIRILCHTIFKQITKRGDGRLDAELSDGNIICADQVLMAIGRLPNSGGLGLEALGLELGIKGAIPVDAYSRTAIDNIWAIGDVTNRVQLTPVAIHEAMCLVETLWKNNPTSPDHDVIPTAVFSQPEIGTVGMTEEDACKAYPEIEVYRATFRPMKTAFAGRDERMLMKLIVDADSKVVLGAHILGPDAGEMAQLLGIPLKAKLTKEWFDRTMAVHPTAAEELVTMYSPSYRVRNGERIAA
ncbi:glutathione-disulfide reductase [Tianweitania sediminis]|uniref:Glutathione reductase n=1 Tax=Tianweitania sediminis TaxID=1502156 RepID=A0A8J7UJ81_9HYPH|nr:glutathione-disulfide reductase [Tianweitania sediminis]MBP0439743.1 glutathione-disulfide reductase [Tianweitania sediminis]